jgi:hypothetical protein
MLTQEWTLLVQQVDRLILELKRMRHEARHWRTRALELESLHGSANHDARLESQTKDRELEKLKKERTKTLATLERMLTDLETVQSQVLKTEEEV